MNDEKIGKVIEVCISEKKGTEKKPCGSVNVIADFGIENDAHAGKYHRQVSLLSLEKIEEFRKLGANVDYGAFGENIIVSGLNLRSYKCGTCFRIGDVLLELTQIGKECHSQCAIRKMVGDCIMPREGVFCRVLNGGKINAGDTIEVISIQERLCSGDSVPFTAAVITLSDRASSGVYEDLSGPEANRILEENGFVVEEYFVLPDDRQKLELQLKRLSDQRQINLICTTGGTGFSIKDVTPEATCSVCERMAPGISEAIRANSMKITEKAMLSRGVSGIRGSSLIVNLPGSPKAVRESLEFIIPALKHGLGILNGIEDN